MIEIGNHYNGKYYEEYDGEGSFYKNEEAFLTNRDEICYIAECGFENEDEECAISDEEALRQIDTGAAMTHNSLFSDLKDYLIDEFGRKRIEDEFVERCCSIVFYEVAWECPQTDWAEVDFEEDLIDYIIEKATKRDDWQTSWDTDCARTFFLENLYNIHTDIDSLIDQFVDCKAY